MSIDSASILVGGTTSTTGGSATTFIVKGDTLNEKRVILDNSAAFADETKVQFSIKDPVVNSGAPNGYTQARSTAKILVPLALDNGLYTVNTVTISVSFDPETTSAEKDNLIDLAVQLLNDSDYSDFWKKQSLS